MKGKKKQDKMTQLTFYTSNDISANNDRRSAHNALERQRREHLNLKYQQLAEALPTLKSTRRPSKATIVTSSLEFGNSRFFFFFLHKLIINSHIYSKA
jgi:hypothetical protein